MSVQDLIISLWSSITIALSACATWIANLGILSKLAAFATNHPYVCYLGLFWLSFSDEVVAAIGWPARFTCSMIFKGSAAVYKFVCKCLGFGEQGIERDSYASLYQGRVYGAYTLPNTYFSHYQSVSARDAHYYDQELALLALLHASRSADDDDEAPEPVAATVLYFVIRWGMRALAVFVLGRHWGWF